MDKWYETDYPEQFDALPEERQQFLLNWISENLVPIQNFNHNRTSYGLKHMIPEDEYFTNGEFKGAMLKAGYKVHNKAEINWIFNVSENSPAIKLYKSQ